MYPRLSGECSQAIRDLFSIPIYVLQFNTYDLHVHITFQGHQYQVGQYQVTALGSTRYTLLIGLWYHLINNLTTKLYTGIKSLSYMYVNYVSHLEFSPTESAVLVLKKSLIQLEICLNWVQALNVSPYLIEKSCHGWVPLVLSDGSCIYCSQEHQGTVLLKHLRKIKSYANAFYLLWLAHSIKYTQ